VWLDLNLPVFVEPGMCVNGFIFTCD